MSYDFLSCIFLPSGYRKIFCPMNYANSYQPFSKRPEFFKKSTFVKACKTRMRLITERHPKKVFMTTKVDAAQFKRCDAFP